jgi:hypothetical protein
MLPMSQSATLRSILLRRRLGPGWSAYNNYVAADFNSDGKADLAATNAADGTLARWWGDGAGGFTVMP